MAKQLMSTRKRVANHAGIIRHDGKPAARTPDMPGMLANPNNDVHGGRKNATTSIHPRDGKAKAHQVVNLHDGMTAQQRALKGMGHAVSVNEIPDASSGNPLDKQPLGKRLSPPAVYPGMRRR